MATHHIDGRRETLFAFLTQLKRSGISKTNTDMSELATLINSCSNAIITHGLHIHTCPDTSRIKPYSKQWRMTIKNLGNSCVTGLTNSELAFDLHIHTVKTLTHVQAARQLASILRGPSETIIARATKVICQSEHDGNMTSWQSWT